ncbi:MAG TPA: transposase, partial [Acetobacteraceae bacterium]|nr:transposase [Acetobacteraceae bacterium]
RRDARYVEHGVETLVGQRIFGLALGYEDLNDHDELRRDPTFAVLAVAVVCLTVISFFTLPPGNYLAG